MKKFPKEVYVQWTESGDEEWLAMTETIDDLDETISQQVAVYKLVEVKKFKVTRELV